MKQKIQLAICITIVMICLRNLSIAQPFITNGGANSYYGETDATGSSSNWIRRIGIGNFSSNTDEPHAFLHVNSNYLLLPSNGSITDKGQLFRTDGPSGVDHQWRMFSDNSSSNTEKFNVTNFDGSTNVSLGTVQNGKLFFNSQATQRMAIDAGGTGALTGFVGIGNNFSNPASRLHINQGSSENNYFQMTGNNTGTTSGDGFRIGVTNTSATASTQAVSLNQQETAPMNFLTSGLPRMQIFDDGSSNRGHVGIGDYSTFTPVSHLHLHGNNDYETMRLTNSNTGVSASDGLVLGIDNNIAFVKNQEEAPMQFFTNNTMRLQIEATGNVEILNDLKVNNTIRANKIIITTNTEQKDLLILIEQLRQKINSLEQQLIALAKN